MSIDISIRGAVKKYGETTVIPNLSLDINNGEFFTLLGPSGCGKTTLLRMIAGFNSIEGGDFFFNKVRINDLDPAKRNIGMVFQNYAIFPHLTVKKNVSFGLENRHMDKTEMEIETQKFLELMQISEYQNRKPENLSGGQQQRVALARALVIKPDVLLMDEPLSNLDAKLRVEMRTVIKELQHSINITTVYVTHDQEEAMAISDRIAVMKDGVIQHIGTPQGIYQRPANLFVATFIGRTNVLNARLEMESGKALLCCQGISCEMPGIREEYCQSQNILLSVRPEEFVMENSDSGGIRARIDDSVFLGLNTHYFVTLQDGVKAELVQESQIGTILPPGTNVSLKIKTEKVNLFTEDGCVNLLSGVVNDVDRYAGGNSL